MSHIHINAMTKIKSFIGVFEMIMLARNCRRPCRTSQPSGIIYRIFYNFPSYSLIVGLLCANTGAAFVFFSYNCIFFTSSKNNCKDKGWLLQSLPQTENRNVFINTYFEPILKIIINTAVLFYGAFIIIFISEVNFITTF